MRVSPLWLGLGKCESAALLACGLIASSCAPSHRLIHEGDRYFERCYGADFDAKVAVAQKEACWQAWITYYTKHQPAHRVDYALARIESLQDGDAIPTLPELSRDAETSADAGSQVQARPFTAGEPSQVTLAPGAGPVPSGCLHFCNEYESSCNARCDHANLACSANCEHERGLCLHGCY